MDDSRSPAPLAGTVTSWDLSGPGHVLTLYWTGENAELLHAERIGSTVPWTLTDVHVALAERGQTIPRAPRLRWFAATRHLLADVRAALTPVRHA